MLLIVIIGMRQDAKSRLAHTLLKMMLISRNASLTVLDNGDEPLRLDS